MGLFFKSKKKTTNTSDNNITINSTTDVLFNIGVDIGEIKTIIAESKNIIKDLDERLKKVERIVFAQKGR